MSDGTRSTLDAGACRVERAPFGTAPDGRAVDVYTLATGRGTEARILTWGGVLQVMRVRDREGALADVTLGHDTLAEYVADRSFLGGVIGRYANRIARGRFTLDGRAYALACNDGPNHLHGGLRAFHKVVWDAEARQSDHGVGVRLTLVSPDGDEGYPGTLRVEVTYSLTPADELIVDYAATTDAPTPVNLTQHGYWNLGGHGVGTILDHELTLAASRFTPVDATMIPTGELRPVAGTPFDFRDPTPIGARIGARDEQLRLAGGYDHNFVLDRPAGDGLARAARLRDPRSGRTLEILTTEPGIQCYSGNSLTGQRGKAGRTYAPRSGVALETQHFPDSPNQPAFPSTILRPGMHHRARTVYRFGIDRAAR